MTWELILAIAGGIVLLGNAGMVIYKWIQPAINMKDDVKQLKLHDESDFKSIKKTEELNKALCQGMICMMNHMIDGNHVDKMKETRDGMLELMAKM